MSSAHLELLTTRIADEYRGRFEPALHDVILVLAGTLPKTTSGKLQRLYAKNQYLAGDLKTLFRRSTDVASRDESSLPYDD